MIVESEEEMNDLSSSGEEGEDIRSLKARKQELELKVAQQSQQEQSIQVSFMYSFFPNEPQGNFSCLPLATLLNGMRDIKDGSVSSSQFTLSSGLATEALGFFTNGIHISLIGLIKP